MKLPRSIGLVDLGVVTVVLVMVVLPPREMYAAAAHKGDEAAQFALALAEARTIAYPDDGNARRPTSPAGSASAGFKDWAIEAAVDGAERAKGSPTAWRRCSRPRSRTSTSSMSCRRSTTRTARSPRARHVHETACPSWEEVRMRLYQQHLDAGVQVRHRPAPGSEGVPRRGRGRTALDPAQVRRARAGADRARRRHALSCYL